MKSKRYPLILCFLIPIIVTVGYFIFRHFAPFGNSSILTVDMGQQYIDFFAHYRDTLLHNPSGILYSFAKGLGGDMFGTWSYYLMSPVNLLILLFPISMLPSVLALMTILKYGLAGLSFGYFLQKKISSNRLACHWLFSFIRINGLDGCQPIKYALDRCGHFASNHFSWN